MKNKNVILFQTHIITNDILREFQRILKASEGYADTYLLFDDKGMQVPDEVKKLKYFPLNKKTISQLNYPMLIDSKIMAEFPDLNAIQQVNNQLGLFNFYLKNQDYNNYWFIEYDVRYSGNWKNIFECFDDSNISDFITSHIRYYFEEPKWIYWYLSHPVNSISEEKRIRSFNTIMRLSNRALKFLHNSLTDGWAGHLEVLISTLLYKNAFTMEDFGGDGKFCKKENINKHYIGSRENIKGTLANGTMRGSPHMFYLGFKNNKLYHPVKPLKNRVKYFSGKLKRLLKMKMF